MAKASVKFSGLDALAKKLNISEGRIKKAVESALERSSKYPEQDMVREVSEGAHYRTGMTRDSYVPLELEWDGTVAKGSMGFSIRKGGLASIFLNLGTPRQRPTFFIDNAMKLNERKIYDEQQKALEDIFKGLI